MKKLICIVALGFGLNSCCKDAGEGGEATLVVRLKHHGVTINNSIAYPDTVWIKFDAEESPGGTSTYDKFYVGSGTEDHVHIEGLKCGNYYLYGAGFDTAGPYRVFGGQGMKIKHSNRKKEVTFDLNVAE